eukprot:3563055-Amphidinium_carterae.1
MQVEEEGQKEVELYEKYVCHCKTFGGSLEASTNPSLPKCAPRKQDIVTIDKTVGPKVKQNQHVVTLSVPLVPDVHRIKKITSFRPKATPRLPYRRRDFLAELP